MKPAGKIAAAEMVEQAGRQVEQTVHDARFQGEHHLLDGRIHDALAEEGFAPDEEHQGAGGQEERPDAVGLALGERVDQALLHDGKRVAGRGGQQNAGKDAEINPAPGTDGGTEKPEESAQGRSLGVRVRPEVAAVGR